MAPSVCIQMISDIPNLICLEQYPPPLRLATCSFSGSQFAKWQLQLSRYWGQTLWSHPRLLSFTHTCLQPSANLVSSTRKNASRIRVLGTPSASDHHSSLWIGFQLLLWPSHAANPLPCSVLQLAARRSFLEHKSDHVILPLPFHSEYNPDPHHCLRGPQLLWALAAILSLFPPIFHPPLLSCLPALLKPSKQAPTRGLCN